MSNLNFIAYFLLVQRPQIKFFFFKSKSSKQMTVKLRFQTLIDYLIKNILNRMCIKL